MKPETGTQIRVKELKTGNAKRPWYFEKYHPYFEKFIVK